MKKRTEYTFKVITGSDEAIFEMAEMASALKSLIPYGQVEFESVKSDFGQIKITIEAVT